MDGAKVLRDLRSGRNVTVCYALGNLPFPAVKLRLVPDFVTGSLVLWSIGVCRGRTCLHRLPAYGPMELEERLYGLEVCED